MEDKLIVSGVHEEIDGSYPCDILGMLTVGHSESLNMREYHEIKVMTGLVAGNLFDSILQGDTDGNMAIAAAILRRHNKVFEEDWLWGAKPGELKFEMKAAKEDIPPPNDAPKSTPTSASEPSGGVPSDPSSENQERDQSGTGNPPTDTSAT